VSELKEKLQAARYAIIRDRPYFAQAFLAMDLIESDSLSTMGVDKYWRMYFNPKFTEAQSHDTLKGLLLHEMLHLLRDHSGRAKSYGITRETHELWNIAVDMEINDDIKEEGWELPDGLFYPGTFGCEDNKCAEEYYEKIYKKAEKVMVQCFGKDGKDGSVGRGQCGSGAHGQKEEWEEGGKEGKKGKGGKDNVPEGIGEIDGDLIRRQTAKEIVEHQKTCGNMPGYLIRWSEDILGPPKIDWRKELRNVIKKSLNAIRYGREDYTYKRLSRRSIPNVILPSMVAYDVNMSVVIDTSGSINSEELVVFLREIRGILSSSGQSFVNVISCDAEVHSCVAVKNVMDLREKIMGGGGTDMREAFHYVDKQKKKPDFLVIFTDGYTPWIEKEPKYGTIAVITKTGTTDGIPKWMKHLKLDE